MVRARRSDGPVIDIHCHRECDLAADFMKEAAQAAGKVSLGHGNPTTQAVNRRQLEHIRPKMDQLDVRLADMDAMGVDVQAVALAVYQYYYWADAETGAKVARLTNEELVESTASYGDRFLPLGTVPLQDTDAAVRELRYLTEELGMRGIEVGTHVEGELAAQFATASRDKFRRVEVRLGRDGMPVLADALATLECEVVEQVSGGTHTIFLGRVVPASAEHGQPLTYFRGDFGRFEFARDDEVYRQARQLVLARVYAADDVVVVAEMATALGVHESAAFYALTRLAADGLVRRDPDRGYVVTPFDVHTSDETFEARLTIELGVIEQVVGRLTPTEVDGLRALFDAMAALLVGDRFVDFEGYLDANYAFHAGLVALAGNSMVDAAFGALSIKSVMTRSFGSTPVTSQQFIEVQRELMEAVAAGDRPAAAHAAREYCELAKQRVRDILQHTGGSL